MTPLPFARTVGVGTVLFLAVGAVSSGQSPQTSGVFRGAANLVEVMVRVTDEQGQFVPGLTITDFEILDECADHRRLRPARSPARGHAATRRWKTGARGAGDVHGHHE